MRMDYYLKRRIPKPTKPGVTLRKRKPKHYWYVCILTSPPAGNREVSTKLSNRSAAEACVVAKAQPTPIRTVPASW
jgi:hypothetical protein